MIFQVKGLSATGQVVLMSIDAAAEADARREAHEVRAAARVSEEWIKNENACSFMRPTHPTHQSSPART